MSLNGANILSLDSRINVYSVSFSNLRVYFMLILLDYIDDGRSLCRVNRLRYNCLTAREIGIA